MYTMARFAVDVLVTLVLSGVFFLVSDTAGWDWAYWICLILAAGIVFLGEVFFFGDNASGSWLD